MRKHQLTCGVHGLRTHCTHGTDQWVTSNKQAKSIKPQYTIANFMIRRAFIEALNTEIDERVSKLVDALDDLPDISTISCCGGHEYPRGNQVKSDRFYVSFSTQMEENRPSKKGWRSLGIVERATNLSNIKYIQKHGEKDIPYYDVIICNLTDGHDDGSLTMLDFEIRGRLGADPNMLADNIWDIANAL